jgi:catechol 2,3-dioxygenase-like lactoylglutathione lyase family enzyme
MKKMELNNISVIVRNLEEATKFWMIMLGLEPPKKGHYYYSDSGVSTIDEPGHKIKYGFLHLAEDTYLELVEPIKGPRVKVLKEKGEGAIYMLGLRVDNIEKWYDEMIKKGITPVDSVGSPLTDKKYLATPSGSKIFFLPQDKTSGLLIEFIERASR